MRLFHSLSARLQLLVTTIILLLTGAMLWLLWSANNYTDTLWQQRVERVNQGWQTLQQSSASRVTSALQDQFEAQAHELMLRGRSNRSVTDAIKEGTSSAFGNALFTLQTLPNVPEGAKFTAYDLSGKTDQVTVEGSLEGSRKPWVDALVAKLKTLTGTQAIEGVTGFSLIGGEPYFTSAGLVHRQTREAIFWQGVFAVAIPMEGFLEEVRSFLSTEDFPAALALLSPDGQILTRQGELASGLQTEMFASQGAGEENATQFLQDGRLARTVVPITGADGKTEAYLSAITSMSTIHSILADRSRLEAAEAKNSAWGLGLALVVLALGSGAFFWVARHHLQRPIQALRQEMARIAENDLSQPVAHTESTELGDLQSATEDMRQTLNSQMRSNREQSNQLAAASEELNASAEGLSDSAQAQSKRSEEVSNSVQEVNQVVQDVANNISEVSDAAGKVNQQAQDGSKSAARASKQMEDLKTTTDSVDQITGTIQDIAKKTDLLALNAAIEAANAGEQGKGFAVVADEVRKLAEQTDQASNQVQSLIGQLEQESRQAVDKVNNVETAFDGIEEAVSETDQMANQIAAAAEELAATMSQTTQRVDDVAAKMSEVSGESHRIEEVGQGLNTAARQLSQTVKQYRLPPGAGAA